jgi:hypothetical protein
MGFTQYRDPAVATVAELATSAARRELSFALAKDVAANTREYVQQDRDPPAVDRDPPAVDRDASPSPEPPAPEVPATRRRSPRARTILVVTACVLALLAIPATAIGMHLGPAASAPTAQASRDTRQVSVTAAQATTVIFQGVPGTLSVVGADTTRVSLTGQLHWTGRAPVATTQLGQDTHVLMLAYQCAPASPCTEDYRLVVPVSDAIVLRQSSARLTLSALAGPVSVTAASVQVVATGLRAPALVATITSGTLSASFDAAPSLVSVTLTSAQGTLRLPADTTYQVSQQVADGNVTIDVPQAGNATHQVTARVTSGGLQLLPP